MASLFGWSKSSTIVLVGIVIFFILAIINRQLNNLGVDFNPLFAYGGFIIVYLVVAFVFSVKLAIFFGLLAGIVLGLLGSFIMGGDDGAESG